MDVRVADHQVETSDSLHQHAAARIAEITEKYFARSIGANVTFERGPNNDFTCNVLAPVAKGVVLKASHSASRAQMAFSGAADRIEKQLRRYVKRLREHKPGAGDDYVENASYTIFSAARESDDAGEHPPIVAEMRVDVPDASVSDAVMLMDLRNTNALLFKNSASGQFNMIYRREDGTIGWVEPHDA